MEQLPTPRLLDEHGQPLSPRIDGALRTLFPKFRKKFPFLRDDVEVIELFEKAGANIALREARHGPIEKLHAFAWVTLKNVALSWLRRGSVQMRLASIDGEDSRTLLSIAPSPEGTPEQIEKAIMLRESMECLTEDEWLVCHLKVSGYSGDEIARQRGSSTAAANMVFSRAIQKLRRAKRRS
jgi:RNA polymerase sigma factor (sigma-70 family)